MFNMERLFHSLANEAVTYGRVAWWDLFVHEQLSFRFIFPLDDKSPLCRVTYTQSLRGADYHRVIRIEDFYDSSGRVFEIVPSGARVYIINDETGQRSPERNAPLEELAHLANYLEPFFRNVPKCSVINTSEV